jgi:hypothetical protein
MVLRVQVTGSARISAWRRGLSCRLQKNYIILDLYQHLPKNPIYATATESKPKSKEKTTQGTNIKEIQLAPISRLRSTNSTMHDTAATIALETPLTRTLPSPYAFVVAWVQMHPTLVSMADLSVGVLSNETDFSLLNAVWEHSWRCAAS